MAFLKTAFFERDVLTVARDLIGVELEWQGCSGVIVETEAYAAEGDAACHTASRASTREFVQKQPPGTAYVYLNYGMYWLFNLLVKGGGSDGLVLIRALEPRRGIAAMQARRNKQKAHELCSGPGKLSRALGINGVRENGVRLQLADKMHSKPNHLPRHRVADGMRMETEALPTLCVF